MTKPIRLGAVGYLNARPLVQGLPDRPDLFSIRFDVPSTCATLLHEGAIDLGMIPAIELFADPEYLIVPGASIASNGPVASVALYTTRATSDIRSIALDSSSRTSAALVRVLCADRFRIAPSFTTMAPDLEAMLATCDAALLIGDKALFTDHEAAGLRKIDLGSEWTDLTGLPFVWAFWAGRPGAASDEVIAALGAARDRGVGESEAIAREYVGRDASRATVAVHYLREHIQYGLEPLKRNALMRFYEMAADAKVISASRIPAFF